LPLIKLKQYDCIKLFQNFNVLIGVFILYYYMAIILEDILVLKIQKKTLQIYLHWGFLFYLHSIIYSSNFYYDLFSHIKRRLFSRRATKSTPAFVGSPTTANCRLPSTGPTSAVNGPDVCRQRARRLPSTGQTDKITKSSLTSAVDGPDICRQRARQTKFSKVARRLPLTGQTDKIPKGSPTSAVDRPDVCRWRARHLLSTGQKNQVQAMAQHSTINLNGICCQQARCLLSTCPKVRLG
jgi:hypothetical protein